MNPRALLGVALPFLVLLGSVGLTAGVGAEALLGGGEALDDVDADDPGSHGHVENDSVRPRTGGDVAQYKVSLDNVTIRTWLLRNATVRNATVERVVVRNLTSSSGARENVTATNVTVGRFFFERGQLKNVSVQRLVVRNRSVLDVPGGDFFDPQVENRIIDRQWTANATVAGVVIDRITIEAGTLCENVSLGQRAEDSTAFDPRSTDDKPAITVQNGTVEEALVLRGAASNWSVESVDEPEITTASLPKGCKRG